MRSSLPPNVPLADRMPEMPLNTLRSAWSKVNAPSSGVSPGSSGCHGPNVPFVAISPGGTRVGQRRVEGHRPVERDRPHVEIVDGPHLRLLVLLAGNDDELGVLRDEVVDDDRPA